MANTIRAKEVNATSGTVRPVEIAVGAADASYVDTMEPVTLLSVGRGNAWEREISLEPDAAWDLVSAILTRLGQQIPERIAA